MPRDSALYKSIIDIDIDITDVWPPCLTNDVAVRQLKDKSTVVVVENFVIIYSFIIK